jgi:hypothetical protein
VKFRKSFDALVDVIIAGLSQIKRKFSGSQPNDYSGYIYVKRNSQMMKPGNRGVKYINVY